MKSSRTRRAGATETVGVSLDAETKRKLKELAAARHGGNVSALITEMTEEAVRREAFARAWQWYGGPELSDAARSEIDAELDAAWKHARKHARKSSGRTSAA